MKKVISLLLVLAIGAMALTACGGGESASGSDSGSGSTAAEFDTSKDITVVSREDGSGTRSAFIELTGVEVEDGDTTVDMTTETVVKHGDPQDPESVMDHIKAVPLFKDKKGGSDE